MKANHLYLNQPKNFWANIRTISQHLGYTERQTGRIKVPSMMEIVFALSSLGLNTAHVVNDNNEVTELGNLLLSYFEYRADILNGYVRKRLMNVNQAREVYERLNAQFAPVRPAPLNKQKGEKKAPAYFTAIINILIESNAEGLPCDYDPRKLTSITRDGVPLRTLARRVDGAFPSVINPLAIWEIKEYYYTTTFGSRVADGVYETLLDGMELEELREHEQIEVRHYLMIDDYNTWWNMGRSYLCRIIDMLHMGYIEEALFGYEVVERLPELVKEWVEMVRK